MGPDAVVDLIEHPILDYGANFGVVEEHTGLPSVAVHAVDDQILELLVEGIREVVPGVSDSCLL